MDLFTIEVEFVSGINQGQVRIFSNLSVIQVFDIHESFSLKILRESNIYVKANFKPLKRITIEEFIYNIWFVSILK